MRRTHAFLFFAGTLGIAGFVACTSTTNPPPINVDTDAQAEDGASGDAPHDAFKYDAPQTDSGKDASSDADADTDAAPATCRNTIKDGFETDVDCGGSVCPKCLDTQACVAPTDCAGGSCANNVCVTAACNDTITNGTESDKDCGGKTCAPCTIGKHCNAPSDCLSKSCDTFNACACPPRMVAVATSAALGGSYCVDETETTNGEYDRFIKASQSISQQIATCAPDGGTGNASYVPVGNWPPAQPLSGSYGLPVRGVNWCDAYAFCKWSGKQLCGKIGGGANAPSDANDQSKSAWFNACSAQGANVFPYGASYVSVNCVGGETVLPDGGPGPLAWSAMAVSSYSDTGSYSNIPSSPLFPYRTCQGGTTGLYGMSGNVAEWENSCADAGPDDACQLRGGSWTAADSQAALRCDAARTAGRMTHTDDIGFRCCLF